ncbi:hypothetical protein P389DRAFT_14601 [Cystobasidium minutum MCA 4210]|uniref:uncharacterized protein n=1 Tax=Cystobasidium minutum MCA 4210 TaxID=1397322 RepID=UPI0034CEA12B|eukprot:jgi/Rhomi1/14601/CE14600_830
MATSKPPRRRRQSPLSSSSGTLPSSSRGASRCKCIGIAAAALLSASTVQAQLSQPNPCIRWGHSSTLGASSSNSSAQSTLYIYGGDAKTDTSQTANTRTNALISLDVSTNWSIASPPLKLVEPDSGDDYEPVARTCLGAGFSSADGQSLYYYGGYFSDNPTVAPDSNKLYRYSLSSGSWSTVNTGGDTVTRVAEGASAVAPPQGDSDEPTFFYFGGHIDSYTTEDWSNQTPRVYLNSMIEYDQSSNSWNNHSSYSNTASVTSNSTVEVSPLLRADSTLTFVPGLGTNGQGILVSIGGGNENQLIDNSILDVYDLGAQGWVKQATQGYTIGPRVSHCAVRGSAKVNGQMQHQIFVYGGQASNRTTQILQGQNSDLYVLSIPSFTWTYVGGNLPSQPTGRAAHTCTLLGSQMIVVGGFVSEDLLCEQPGIYVLDTTELAWKTSYTANTVYTTPDHEEIIAVTGGRGTGSSVAGSGYAIGTGANDTDTSAQFRSKTEDTKGGSGGGSNTGAIAGGVVGGVLGLALLAGLAWYFFIYRKKKREEQEMREKPILNGSPGSQLSGNPYDDPALTRYAADDVEEATAGYNAQFSHLVPRQELRVVNE